MGDKKKFASSYIGELSSGFDAKGYDGPLLGKKETEEVTQGRPWAGDKRDAIGRAATLMKRKRLARKLRRIAREIEAMESAEMDGSYQDDIEETQADVAEQIDDVAEGLSPEDMEKIEAQDDEVEPVDSLVDMDEEEQDDEIDEEDDPNEVEPDNDEDDYLVEASHPIEHDPKKDDPQAFADAQTGDDEWISIGTGKFDDARNDIGKAAKKVARK